MASCFGLPSPPQCAAPRNWGLKEISSLPFSCFCQVYLVPATGKETKTLTAGQFCTRHCAAPKVENKQSLSSGWSYGGRGGEPAERRAKFGGGPGDGGRPADSPCGCVAGHAGSASRRRRNCSAVSPAPAAPTTAPARKPFRNRREPPRRDAKLLAAIAPQAPALRIRRACARRGSAPERPNRWPGDGTRMRGLGPPPRGLRG